MVKAANLIVDRAQDFCQRFAEVESKMSQTVKSMNSLKITVADSGPSIVTAAKKLIKAGAQENKKKPSLQDANEEGEFIE
jgi:DNA recombination protein RmuC